MAFAAHDQKLTPCPTCGGAGRVLVTQGYFSVERTCPKCHGSGKTHDNSGSTCDSSELFQQLFLSEFRKSQQQNKSRGSSIAGRYVLGALIAGIAIFFLWGEETGNTTPGRSADGRQMISNEGNLESTAETWAKVSGALLGMANACDLKMSTRWTGNVTRHMRTLATDKDELARAAALFLDYGQRAYDNQKEHEPMTCQEIAQFAADSEKKWGK
jgi:hypothetical protein